MKPYEAEYHLRGFPLDGIDVENLRIGRITRIVMYEVLVRHKVHANVDDARMLADELNSMIEAAAVLAGEDGP